MMTRPLLRFATALTFALAAAAVGATGTNDVVKNISQAVADPARPAADRARDADRKPVECVAFAGLKRGDRIADLIPGGGYFTRIFSATVGPQGHVYAIAPPRRATAPADAPDPAAPVQAIAADPHYANVSVSVQRVTQLTLADSLDLIWTSQNYHDIHNVPDVDLNAFNKAVFDALKPGGIYIVLDHVAQTGSGFRDTKTLHRIDADAVKYEVLAVGFVFDDASDAVRSTEDNHTLAVFDPALHDKTDRFLLRFHKPVTAGTRFTALYTTEWKWREDQFADDEDGQRGIQDHLPKVDPATQEMRLKYWEDVLKQLDGINRAELSAEQQVNYDIYHPQIEVLIARQRFRDFEMPANADTTFWTDLGYTARKTFRNVDDYRNWLKQMRDVPRYFHEEMDEMRGGLKRGFTPPRVTLEGRDASITAIVEAAAAANVFYTPFKEMPGILPADQASLRAEAVATIHDLVQPAYAELLKFWRTQYLPKTRTALAAEDLPDGKAFYQSKIREFTTLDLDPAAIHRIGEAEVARLHEEMLGVMKETGFTGDFPAFLKFLRTDPQFYAKTPDELLMRASWIAKKFDAKSSQYFGYLPRMRFAIKPVPDDLAPFYTAGRGGPGLYLVNTYNLPARPLYSLAALTLHESAPGHAFQMPIAMEHKNQPEFRQHVYISAFGEGWALYCEKLGMEMGMYETPYDRFGMLSYQMWRAARLVVDTGVHTQHWTRSQANQYLQDYTALPEHEIETEVDRYIAWPGQALSYYLGEMSIVKSRAKAEAALGAKFSIRAFHDTVLELGSAPLPVLEARIDRFIAEGGKGPYPELE